MLVDLVVALDRMHYGSNARRLTVVVALDRMHAGFSVGSFEVCESVFTGMWVTSLLYVALNGTLW